LRTVLPVLGNAYRAIGASRSKPSTFNQLFHSGADVPAPGKVRDFRWLGFRQNLGDNPPVVRYANLAMLESLPDQLASPAVQFPDCHCLHVSQCDTLGTGLSIRLPRPSAIRIMDEMGHPGDGTRLGLTGP